MTKLHDNSVVNHEYGQSKYCTHKVSENVVTEHFAAVT